MPAKEVMKKFHKGKLHSGSKHGPVVKNPKQAKAILLSELRDEGRIPARTKKARNKRLEKEKL
jgi:hypothetical protein